MLFHAFQRKKDKISPIVWGYTLLQKSKYQVPVSLVQIGEREGSLPRFHSRRFWAKKGPAVSAYFFQGLQMPKMPLMQFYTAVYCFEARTLWCLAVQSSLQWERSSGDEFCWASHDLRLLHYPFSNSLGQPLCKYVPCIWKGQLL